MRSLLVALLFLSSLSSPAFSQIQHENIHVNFYFPLIQDGTSGQTTWRTFFLLTNPGKAPATITLNLISGRGEPMTVAVGTVQSSGFRFTLPAGATRSVTTVGDTPFASGWAMMTSSHPIMASARLLSYEGTTMRGDVQIDSVLPTLSAWTDARANTVLSIANVYSDTSITVVVRLADNNGEVLQNAFIPIAAFGRLAATLSQIFPNLPTNFSGSVTIDGSKPGDIFVASVAQVDGLGNLRGTRPAKLINPVSHYDNLWLTFKRITAQAKATFPDLPLDDVEFQIGYDPVINAFAADGKVVRIYAALAQLINDSPSEMAFIVGHELGHILQQRSGALVFNPNPEFDADAWGALLALNASYDPYGAAGALSRLAMATGRSGLAAQFEDQLAEDAHKSFNERLDSVFELLKSVCSSSESAKRSCDAYKSVLHPNFPEAVPLSKPGTSRTTPQYPSREIKQSQPPVELQLR
jgi:hypothetical protein